jgi:DNA-binding response OmpR family regulator
MTARGARARLLLLDDHRESLAALAIALAHRGFHCETVTNAADASTRCRIFAPDIVVYEWRLRAGPVLGLARTLRTIASDRTVVVIVASWLDEPPDFARTEGVDAYLTKPLDLTTLETLLGRSAR